MVNEVKVTAAAEEAWDQVITPKRSWLTFNFDEVWRYRDLIVLFTKRNLVATHKQTVLGPLWHVIQPLMTTLAFTIVFGTVARIPTGGIDPFLYYLTSITIWSFFARCLTSTSNTFVANAGIFGKVYFPRLVIPISSVLAGLVSFGIQMLMLALVFVYYGIFEDFTFPVTAALLWIPLLMLLMLVLGFGLGIIISALTTKYRDFNYFISFGVQLLMYITPVIYPLSAVPAQYQKLTLINPLSPLVEGFRYALLGIGSFDMSMCIYSALFSFGVFLVGVLMFNKVERTFMDTV